MRYPDGGGLTAGNQVVRGHGAGEVHQHNLTTQTVEADHESWVGEVEGLQADLTDAEENFARIGRLATRPATDLRTPPIRPPAEFKTPPLQIF